jgi:hypothetical protein
MRRAGPATTGEALEEVVVTSAPREELSKVPISVAAYTQETLEKQSVRRSRTWCA